MRAYSLRYFESSIYELVHDQLLPLRYLAGSTASNDFIILDGSFDNHDCVVERSLNFGDELFRAATQDERASLRIRSPLKQVIPLATNLKFVEGLALAEMLRTDIRDGGLNAATDCSNDAIEVVGSYTSCTKDVAIRKVLRSQVADGKF